MIQLVIEPTLNFDPPLVYPMTLHHPIFNSFSLKNHYFSKTKWRRKNIVNFVNHIKK